ncbi:LamG domain-containing protein [Plantactinospora sp. ZYX-F-223]|uniref:LamG domain-containing protein n=1 Tax=Plantactinospora sp. ZYX-F-223 TaxID=3144103 RepID=UPI0031FE1162
MSTPAVQARRLRPNRLRWVGVGVALGLVVGAAPVTADPALAAGQASSTRNARPGAPTALQVADFACPASGVVPIGTMTPTFSAVYPDADSTQSLTGHYEWIEVPAGGIGTVTATYPARRTPPPPASAPADGRGRTAAISGLTADSTYAFRVKAVDSGSPPRWSPWSKWCQFTPDVSVPRVTVTPVTAPIGPGQPVTFRIESADDDVREFRYGWTDPPRTVVAPSGTNPTIATVTLVPPTFGLNILYVAAVDAAFNEGRGSVELTVPRPAPAVARWGLEIYPGVNEEQALADWSAAPADTPLTATDLTWAPDTRMIGARSASFDGSSSQAVTTEAVLDTTGSYSVAAWVRPGVLPTTDSDVATQEGTDAGAFALGIRHLGSPPAPYWAFTVQEGVEESGATRTAAAPASVSAADLSRWTHLAGVYDRTAGKLRLYVDGVMVAEVDRTATPWAATGRFAVGRGFSGGAPANWWNGGIADLRVYGRALLDHEFLGQLASDPGSGGFDEPGLLAPLPVGQWDFSAAVPCYEPGPDPGLCQAPDGGSFGRRLALSQGVMVDYGPLGNGLVLNDAWEFDPDDPRYETLRTVEYGTSQANVGDEMGSNWQDSPVLRTDDSFTVSVWGRVDETGSRDQALVSQSGVHESAFRLGYEASSGKWSFVVTAEDGMSAAQVGARSPASATAHDWVHLVGVYDAGRRQIRLYVDGEQVGETALPWRPMPSGGALQLGRALRDGGFADYWYGGVDELRVFQGATAAPWVRDLHDKQALRVGLN